MASCGAGPESRYRVVLPGLMVSIKKAAGGRRADSTVLAFSGLVTPAGEPRRSPICCRRAETYPPARGPWRPAASAVRACKTAPFSGPVTGVARQRARAFQRTSEWRGTKLFDACWQNVYHSAGMVIELVWH